MGEEEEEELKRTRGSEMERKEMNEEKRGTTPTRRESHEIRAQSFAYDGITFVPNGSSANATC